MIGTGKKWYTARAMHERSAHHSVLVVGSVALDDIDGPSGMHRDLLGGSASFIATAASYFTRDVGVVAVVGADFPQRHLDGFAARGIDISGIERRSGETFHGVGKYSDDLASRTTLDTRLGVFAAFKPSLGPTHRDARLLFLGNIDPGLERPAGARSECSGLARAFQPGIPQQLQGAVLGRRLAGHPLRRPCRAE